MFDIIIIGAGPAGLTAGIYASMANKMVLLLEKTFVGGQVALVAEIKNYPGFESINGFDLSQKMKDQAKKLGVEILNEEVVAVNLTGEVKEVKTHNNTYLSKAVIIASGAYAKTLDVLNERQFFGKGLSYCATCDGHFFKDKVVAVVGGGDTSVEDCLYLSNLAKKVYLVHRRDVFRAKEGALCKVKALASESEQKVEILTNYVVTQLYGEQKLEKITLLNKISGEEKELKVDGIFVAIGRKPDTAIFAGQVKLNDGGFIETDDQMRTNLKNVYAVGDVRNTHLRQIITACADGAIATMDFVNSENK